MNNKFVITDNIYVSEALVYISAIAFFIAVFPVHVLGYVYISTAEKYASINITLYRLFRIINVNTDKPPEDDGKKKEADKEDGDKKLMTPANWLEMFNKLCLTKIVQLGDYGLRNPDNAYVALANTAVTDAVYTFVRANGGKTKLKNYSVLNYEHSDVNYYLKIEGIINVMTLLKLIAIFYWGKINEK